jgi:hypothetical protein
MMFKYFLFDSNIPVVRYSPFCHAVHLFSLFVFNVFRIGSLLVLPLYEGYTLELVGSILF